jgi:hypothetical protein
MFKIDYFFLCDICGLGGEFAFDGHNLWPSAR